MHIQSPHKMNRSRCLIGIILFVICCEDYELGTTGYWYDIEPPMTIKIKSTDEDNFSSDSLFFDGVYYHMPVSRGNIQTFHILRAEVWDDRGRLTWDVSTTGVLVRWHCSRTDTVYLFGRAMTHEIINGESMTDAEGVARTVLGPGYRAVADTHRIWAQVNDIKIMAVDSINIIFVPWNNGLQ